MNELRLNENHDIFVKNGHLCRFKKPDDDRRGLTRRDCVAQSVLCMLKTEMGEAFSNIEHGVPWFNQILGLPVSYLDVATKILREKISQVEGVKKVISINLSVNGRNASGTFKILTSDDELTSGEF